MKIEMLHVGNQDEAVYHLSIIGLDFPSAPKAGGELQHIPVSEGAMNAA